MSGNKWMDPEGGGGLLDPDDPEGGGGLLDPDDPEGGGGLLDPDDPEGGGGLLDPDDPEGGGGLLDPDDPEGGGGLLDPDDPEGGGGLLDPDDPRALIARREQALRAAQRGRPYDRTGGENTGIPAVSERFSGDVIVRLSSLLPLTDKPNLLEIAEALRLPGLSAVLERFGSPASSRAITAKTAGRPGAMGIAETTGAEQCAQPGPVPGSLDDLEGRAETSTFRPLHSLWSYWRINARSLEAWTVNGSEALPEHGFPYSNSVIADRLVDALNALSEVDLAYREFEASDPFKAPSAEELEDFQFYLEDSPLGLDVRWARELLEDTDEKIALADLEQGWFANHEDTSFPKPVYGDNRHGVGAYKGDHGTAVVSQLTAEASNKLGMVGIAAGVATLSLASHYRAGTAPETGTNGHVADAIAALTTGENPVLGAGDVLLLEVQRAGQPTEVDPLDLDAIRLAVANGIIVVEPAGNGRINLNRLETVDGRRMHRRSVDFVDSGAILVGAARSAAPHNRAWYSNHGSRVDCFAWGDSVVAAGYGNYLSGPDGELYTDTFSGTSSAAPMIAGAAVLVQSLYRQHGWAKTTEERWRRLSPGQMRALLSDPRTGTRQGRKVRGRIGVMPSLRAVLGQSLGIVPQVYLRDHVGDTGESAGREFCSPDILVTQKPVENLGEAFGHGSSYANLDTFDASLASEGTKRICVRCCNRGLLPSGKAKARIYAAPVCTLVTPDRWDELSSPSGGLPIDEVPPGDTFAVSDALEHAKEEDFCLIAVVEPEGGEDGPVPCSPSNFDWGRYLRVMRRQRNVAVRNVYAREAPTSQSLERKFEFAINGTSDASRAFEFEVIQRLPQGVDLELRTHPGLALKFARGRLWRVTRQDVSTDDGRVTLRLPRQPRVPLGVVPLPAGVDFASILTLRGANKIKPGHSLALRQLYRGEEVGRITWRFVATT